MKKGILKKNVLVTLLVGLGITAGVITAGVLTCTNAAEKKAAIENNQILTNTQLADYEDAVQQDALGKTIAIGAGLIAAAGTTIATMNKVKERD